MRMTLAMATVALALPLVTWLSFSALNTSAERFDRALSALDPSQRRRASFVAMSSRARRLVAQL